MCFWEADGDERGSISKTIAEILYRAEELNPPLFELKIDAKIKSNLMSAGWLRARESEDSFR